MRLRVRFDESVPDALEPHWNHLIPKRVSSSERNVLEQGREDDQEAVASAPVRVETGSDSKQFLYVPSSDGEGTTVFATNLQFEPSSRR